MHGRGARGGRERQLARRAEALAQRTQELRGGCGADARGEGDQRRGELLEPVRAGGERGERAAVARDEARARAHQARRRDLGLRVASGAQQRRDGPGARSREGVRGVETARRERGARGAGRVLVAADGKQTGGDEPARESGVGRRGRAPRASPGADPGSATNSLPESPSPIISAQFARAGRKFHAESVLDQRRSHRPRVEAGGRRSREVRGRPRDPARRVRAARARAEGRPPAHPGGLGRAQRRSRRARRHGEHRRAARRQDLSRQQRARRGPRGRTRGEALQARRRS